jgi:RHS repeat-associated protein
VSVRRRASGRAHYNYFRDYDPATGRYVESDAVGLLEGPSTFAYSGNQSTMAIDPKGLLSLTMVASWSDQSSPLKGKSSRGGLTTAYLNNIKCVCECSGGSWLIRKQVRLRNQR